MGLDSLLMHGRSTTPGRGMAPAAAGRSRMAGETGAAPPTARMETR